jgi:hypothetical protein
MIIEVKAKKNNMEQDKPKEPQTNGRDPQEKEKDGNIFGGIFDKVHGDAEGGSSISEDEAKDPDNQESIKDH